MFGIFKKKEEDFKVVACADGTCIRLSDVKDQVFSTKMMGDGFAIIPDGETIVAPIDGTVVTVFPTNHALGIRNKNGVEILLHIGLDTVELNGKGFSGLVKENDKVKAGQPLVKIDRKMLEEAGYDLSTMVIFTAGYEKEIEIACYDQKVSAGEELFR